MGLATILITVSGLMQLASIWTNGPDGHSLGGWICLAAGLLIITDRCYMRGDWPAYYSFFLQSVIICLIVTSIIHLRGV